MMDALLDLARNRDTRPRAPQPGQLHITVGVGEADALLETDERLVRASLLYADRVTLLSPAAYMLDATALMRQASGSELFEIVRRVGPLLGPVDPRMAQLPRALAGAFIEEQAPQLRAEFTQVVDEITDSPAMRALDLVRRRGLLDIDSLARRSNDDDEVLARLGASRTSSSGSNMARSMDVMFARLANLLETDGLSLPLLDDITGDIARQGLEEGLFIAARTTGHRAAEAGAATGFLERLPTFPNATMDEVLDVRDSLNEPLVTFRAEVVRLSEAMAGHALDGSLAVDVEREWRATVQPALTAIDDAVRSDRYLAELRNQATAPRRLNQTVGTYAAERMGELAAGNGLGVVIGHTSYAAIASAAAAFGIGAAFDALAERRTVRDAARSSAFWFLNQTQHRLG